MRDYKYHGQFVADMPTALIQRQLTTGKLHISRRAASHGITIEDVYERLRIELVARGLEGRL